MSVLFNIADKIIFGNTVPDYATFRKRVLATGGTITDDVRLKEDMEWVWRYKPTWFASPAVRKVDVLYGAPDLDGVVTRATTKTGINADGTIGERVAGELPWSYRGGRVSFLPESARTNLIIGSGAPVTQNITVTNVAHTLSFYGTGSIVLTGTGTGTLTGTGANDRVTLTLTPTAGTLTLTISGTVEFAQLEAGSFASSYIPTTTTSLTRNADVLTVEGAQDVIGQESGWIYAEVDYGFISPTALTRGVFWLSNGTSANNGVRIQHSGTNPPFIVLGGVRANNITYGVDAPVNTVGMYKYLVVYNALKTSFFINGVKIGEQAVANSFQEIINTISIGSLQNGLSQLNDHIYRTALGKGTLTEQQAIELTTI
jgi:hypothetical protein